MSAQLFDADMIGVSVEASFHMQNVPDTLVRTHNGDIWSKCIGTLDLYDTTGQHKHSIVTDIEISRFVITFANDIIATDRVNKRLIRVLQSGEVETLLSTAPMEPRSMCINSQTQLVVGQRNGFEKPAKLVIYSLHSDAYVAVKETENDNNGKSLFEKDIGRVRQNGNGDYIVLDGIERIVCLSGEIAVRWEYRGDYITDIACDAYSNVIFCEFDKSQVKLLDKDRRFVCILLTEDSDITSPCSLCIDTNGRLLIGQAFPKYKISIVKYLK